MSANSYWIAQDTQGNVTTKPSDPSAQMRVPTELPTYNRLNCIHSGEPEMETRLRAASLEDSCWIMGATPPDATLMDRIHRTSRVNTDDAQAVRAFVDRHVDNPYLQDEASSCSKQRGTPWTRLPNTTGPTQPE